MNDAELSRLAELVNAHIEDRLTASERAELETAIEAGGERRRVVVDLLHDHATLYWDHVGRQATPDGVEWLSHVPPASARSRFPAWLWASAAALVAVSTLVTGLLIGTRSGRPYTFATLVHVDAATWGGGSLPTATGSRLSEGQFRLEEGLATIQFDSGATVTLEAPAEFALLNAMHARLASGTAVADVPPSAHGFRIETPTARVVDHGTRFAVNVEEDTGTTRTRVFDGLVEVQHPGSDTIVQLREGEQNRVVGDRLDPVGPGQAEDRWAPRPVMLVPRGPGWRLVSTRDGAGKDGYTASSINEHTSTTQLLVKSTHHQRGPRRKAYLGFDLRETARGQLEAAELILTFEPTGWGLASAVPDCEFEVYGLTRPDLENWDPNALPWQGSPGNLAAGNAVDPAVTLLLGSFTVPRGVQKGEFVLRDPRLREFLQNDADGLVTLIIFRKTLEVNDNGLVHGIASSRHPVLPPPTLALKFPSP